MKKQFLSIVGMLTLLAAATVAGYAQLIANLEAKVPFDFMVGETKLTAGKYTISSRNMTSQTLSIRGGENNKRVGFIVRAGERENAKAKSRLVFHRYGNQYFLAEVSDGVNTTQQLIKSKAEREVAKSDRFANHKTEPEIVVIVAE